MASEQGSLVQTTDRAQDSSNVVQAILFDMVSLSEKFTKVALLFSGAVAAHAGGHMQNIRSKLFLSEHAELSRVMWSHLQDGVLCNSEEMTQRYLRHYLSVATILELHSRRFGNEHCLCMQGWRRDSAKGLCRGGGS